MLQMINHNRPTLSSRWRAGLRQTHQAGIDFTKHPWITLHCATNHHAIAVGNTNHLLRRCAIDNIAITNHRNRYGIFSQANICPVGMAMKHLCAGPSMYGEHLNATLFSNVCNRCYIFGLIIPAGTNLQGHRHIHCCNHRLQYACNQCFILEHGRACNLFANLFDRTTHIDIDKISPVADCPACGL